VNYNISVYTGSQNVINNSVNSHILAQSTQTGSQDLVNYNISVYTGSQNVINTSVNSHILLQSTQTGSQDLVNLGISTFTGSLRSEVNLIEAYTASLKGAAIVSSSQQITNYYKFAETASANTFYGNQTLNGNLNINGGNSVRMYESTNTNYWDVYTYTDNTLRANYKGAGNDEIILYNDGNLNLNAAVTASNFKIGVAGGGIDFGVNSSAAGMTSELLNDYEEGTWSPQIYYQNATDQSNSTNVTQVGTYIKVGNVVTVIGVLQWTVTGSPANDNIGIKNFPFTSKTGADYIWWGNVQLVNAGAYPTDGYILRMDNNTTLTLFYDRRSDAGNYGDDIGASGTKTARFTITYFT
jgi:hypothetical protein